MTATALLVLSVPYIFSLVMQAFSGATEEYVRGCIPKIIKHLEREAQKREAQASTNQTTISTPVTPVGAIVTVPPAISSPASGITAPMPAATSPVFITQRYPKEFGEDVQEFGVLLASHVYQHLTWVFSIGVACVASAASALKIKSDWSVGSVIGCTVSVGLIVWWLLFCQDLTPRELASTSKGKWMRFWGYGIVLILWFLTIISEWKADANHKNNNQPSNATIQSYKEYYASMRSENDIIFEASVPLLSKRV